MVNTFKTPSDRIRRQRRPGHLPAGIEPLEERTLLSAVHAMPFAAGFGGNFGRFVRMPIHLPGGMGAQVTFSQLSTAIQNGLTSLATTDNVTAPAATSVVALGNANGVETFTVFSTGTGTRTALTVDQNGNPVTAATHSSTTFGAVSNTAVTTEITTIATALSLTAPTSTTNVYVTTNNGASTYTVTLAKSSTTGRHTQYVSFTVDASGNPTGNAVLPLGVFSTTIQSALTGAAPTGATALTATSSVTVRTLNGVTTYSVTYNATGIRTTVTVNAAGALSDLPSTSTAEYSTIPSAAQAALQTLATAAGDTATIAGTQDVTVTNEGNGTTLYTARVTITKTDSSGNTYTYPLTLTVDEAGNPTVLPGGAFAGIPGVFGRGMFCV
ncbi:MAG TPA: hypothetical protein VH253_18970 [Phycisphaerae bacterium]|nr:hypothetical protein [Phycisphaerae bacterium]